MHQSERCLKWTFSPIQQDPVRWILVVLILAVCSSLVLWWLGPNWSSLLLITVFLFSLRDFLLPASLVVDDMGLTISTPLTGAKCWPWEEIAALERGPRGMRLLLSNGTRRRIPQAPDQAAFEELCLRVEAYLKGADEPEQAESGS